MRVKFQMKLAVGFWELIPLELGADNSAEQNTATVTKDNESNEGEISSETGSWVLGVDPLGIRS